MIGRLRGQLLLKQPPALLLDVAGVGYEIEAPMSTFYQLPELGESVVLHIHFLVREDAQQLYGFISESDRSLFRALIRVTGVGAKMALAILSGMSADEFVRCVNDGDSAALVRLPGIGKKTADRLLVEMRDRVQAGVGGAGAGVATGSVLSAREPGGEAINALEALGYKAPEAARMIRAVLEDGIGTEELIRRALRSTVR